MNLGCDSYTSAVGLDHRKKYGQFFTPPRVADFMVRWVLGSGVNGLYDPAFGLGAFLDAAGNYPGLSFSGSDIDKRIVNYWRRFTPRQADIKAEDYLQAWGSNRPNIVCNPPYMRFQNFSGRKKAAAKFQDKLNIRLSGYTNAASAFLLKSIHELRGQGRLAYIMPLEFLNAGYGEIVKETLVKNKHLAAVIQLKCEDEIFPDAATSIGIVLYDKGQEHTDVGFYALTAVNNLNGNLADALVNRVPAHELVSGAKRLSFFQRERVRTKNSLLVKLKDYGSFKRGIATGANEFFALTPSLAAKLGLTDGNCIPCITKSAQLTNAVFEESDYAGLLEADSAVLLFNGNGGNKAQAMFYVRHGVSKDFHKRYITKSRNPWYKIECREPAPILLNVFSRSGYKVILNNTAAVHLTCCHGFYPNMFGAGYTEKLFLYLASETGRKIVSLSKRQYGNALDKFEPNDLNNALAPAQSVLDELTDDAVSDALSALRQCAALPPSIEDFFRDALLEKH